MAQTQVKGYDIESQTLSERISNDVGVDGTGKNIPAYYSVIFIKRVS